MGNASSLFEQLEDRRLLAAVPLDTGFQLNTYAEDALRFSVTASDSRGNYVSVWEADPTDDTHGTIRAQRHDRTGSPLGEPFQIDADNPQIPELPSVAMSNKGTFIVTWRSVSEDGESSIRARRFNAKGVAQGSEIVVASSSGSELTDPAVAINPKGQFIITWTGTDADGSGIFARQFNPRGIAKAAIQVNTHTFNEQIHSVVALDKKGKAFIAWQSANQDGSGQGIFAQRINSTGKPLGSEFRVNANRRGHQQLPAVAVNSRGTFLISWTTDPQNEDGYEVVARKFLANGSSKEPEFTVHSPDPGDQISPSVAASAKGDFMVAWTSLNIDGAFSTFSARRYDPAGKPRGNPFNAPTMVQFQNPQKLYELDQRGTVVATEKLPIIIIRSPIVVPPTFPLLPSVQYPSFNTGATGELRITASTQLQTSLESVNTSDPVQGVLDVSGFMSNSLPITSTLIDYTSGGVNTLLPDPLPQEPAEE